MSSPILASLQIEQKVKSLVDSLSSRTAHQYKSYYSKYIKWCEDEKLITTTDKEHVLYKELPISSKLFHCFLLDVFITNSDSTTHDDDDDDDSQLSAENISIKVGTLKKIISSLKFLTKLCGIHGNTATEKVDEKYFELIIKLHSHWYSNVININNTVSMTNTYPAILKVSINLWNSQTLNLSEKSFKTCLEKLRFLVDFHFTSYLNLSYSTRSGIKLADLKANSDVNLLTLDIQQDSKLSPMVLLPQCCPFLCPLTSLAAYLYLRFYGIKNIYKGDGFPDVSNSIQQTKTDYNNAAKLSANVVHWLDLPLIRGKSPLDYPKDETMSSYYSTIFRYCHLPYKRREYFQENQIQFPTWSKDEYEELESMSQGISRDSFKYQVPFDFMKIMNHKSPYVSYSTTDSSLVDADKLPSELLVQLFPEIEQYKRHGDILSKDAKEFISFMETLRNSLLKSLPWISHFFPHHDIFKDSIFLNSDFQSYFQEVVGESRKNNPTISLPFDILPGFDKFTENNIYNILIEPPFKANIASGNSLVTLSSVPSGILMNSGLSNSITSDLMEQAFQLVQYQTSSNFKLLLASLSKTFNKLEMKKSSKEYMVEQMNILENSLTEKIGSVKASDILILHKSDSKAQVKLEHDPKKIKRKEKQRATGRVGLLDLDSSEGDDSGSDESDTDDNDEEDADMQEELKFMVNELVGEKVRMTFKTQMEQFEKKLTTVVENMVGIVVEEKVNDILEEKLNKMESRISETILKRNINDVYKEHVIDVSPNKKEKLADIPINELVSGALHKAVSTFFINSNINTIEDIILEWFTPNPELDDECIHSMNKAYGKEWRSGFESLYKERKIIIELYIYLVNRKELDRYAAVQICESLRKQTDSDDTSITALAKFLKIWKKQHNSSFEGIEKTLS